jgi:hypothetical protein
MMNNKISSFSTKFAPFLLLMMVFFAILIGCKPYKDPTPIKTDLLTTPYCNDPKAVNYNWGFPGKPDNSICFFPADLFVGNYKFYDSIYDNTAGVYLAFDSTNVSIAKSTDSTISVTGLCGSSVFTAKATKNARFTLDSTTSLGQLFCSNADTISGGATKWNFNDTFFKFQYDLINNSTKKEHNGIFIKQ